MTYRDLPWYLPRLTMPYRDLPWLTVTYRDLPWYLSDLPRTSISNQLPRWGSQFNPNQIAIFWPKMTNFTWNCIKIKIPDDRNKFWREFVVSWLQTSFYVVDTYTMAQNDRNEIIQLYNLSTLSFLQNKNPKIAKTLFFAYLGMIKFNLCASSTFGWTLWSYFFRWNFK